MEDIDKDADQQKEIKMKRHWWQERFWQILASIFTLLILTIPIPIFLNNLGSTIVLTWTSILVSIGATWYFASVTFRGNQEKVLKERAIVAIRRPLEIARAVQRVVRNITEKKEELSQLDDPEWSRQRKFVLEIIHGIEIHVRELFGHLNYAIADWQDILGEDLSVTDETYRQIEEVLLKGNREIDEIKKGYEERLEKAKTVNKEELKKVESDLLSKIKEKEVELAKAVQEAYQKGKRENNNLVNRPDTFNWLDNALKSQREKKLNSSILDAYAKALSEKQQNDNK
ncbi:MAG: hypothetical protein ABR936_04150 [Bacteroidota bacterium]|jgi:hypothetical protein